ncbi:PH domain-containing protein [Entomospira culicis]|uniref:PH domain-containing protein n=1 Tax=Entomospira culicis TaxID=2719989 RepID=A0A968GG12_9SPIO|nr:PH domain-containing protein [Entomospira culicis]NIZ19635.1 PH domain-containing protein [Entomospira culicis]NIZ69849.1 PH domain-containing protein [Entomospira culicis]WDI36956.1 PH domain-containing protein [Entomospira culicis]WDI38585.1 PH domain-containing protein [Entomospira culicis]
MIDFKNGSLIKLAPIEISKMPTPVDAMLVEGEEILAAFKAMRDSLVFTNKRAISINLQGMTGKKIDFTSLPYSKVQAFSIETAGSFDLDCEIDLVYSGLGTVRFEIKGNFDVIKFNKIISSYVL